MLLVAALAAFTMGMYVYSINTFLAVETKGGIVLVSGGIRTFLFFIFFPGAFGLIGGYIVHLKGGLAYGAILRTLVLFLAFVLQVYGLWLTFSRGALLGLMTIAFSQAPYSSMVKLADQARINRREFIDAYRGRGPEHPVR